MDGVQIIIDSETFKKLSDIAMKYNRSAVEECSQAIQKYIEFEQKKISESNEGKQLLCD